MKLLALDIGNRYIGVATTDHVDVSLAYRFATIDRKTQDVFSVLQTIVDQENVTLFVVGIPYHVEDGSETQQTKTTKEFIAALKERFGSVMKYIEVDETLTSRAAKENLKYEGGDEKQEHAEAARIMLQEYINSL